MYDTVRYNERGVSGVVLQRLLFCFHRDEEGSEAAGSRLLMEANLALDLDVMEGAAESPELLLARDTAVVVFGVCRVSSSLYRVNLTSV